MTTATDLVSQVEAWFELQGFRLVIRQDADGVVADLVGDVNPRVVWPTYASAPDPTLAVLVAEQRWMVEEEGRDLVPGASYLEKARERIRVAEAQ
jgi:hypothetical protein